MSHFYGTMRGGRGTATRCGTKKSGIATHAAGWGGCITVYLHHDEKTETDHFTVLQEPWRGHGTREEIASGIIGQPTKKENGINADLLAACKMALRNEEARAKEHNIVTVTLTELRNAIQKAEG